MKLSQAFLAILVLLGAGTPIFAGEGSFIPERFNKPPRILFNLNDPKETIATEIVPGEFYQDYWQGVRLSILRGRMIMKKGASFETNPGYHGEELIVLLEGQLTFSFPGNGRSYTLKAGDVFHFNNVLHHGICESSECYYIGVLSPPRLDYGDEDTPQSVESNRAISRPQ